MKNLECPYCGTMCEVPDECQEQVEHYECECESCEKIFGFTVDYWPSYTEYVCPCANGESHDYQKINGAPAYHFENQRQCSYCGNIKILEKK